MLSSMTIKTACSELPRGAMARSPEEKGGTFTDENGVATKVAAAGGSALALRRRLVSTLQARE